MLANADAENIQAVVNVPLLAVCEATIGHN